MADSEVLPEASPEIHKPVQIVSTNSDHSFTLHEDELVRILASQEAKNKKIAVVSVAGAFRKGKSFLLDFFLRYLRSEDKSKWLEDEDKPLTGFSWRGGAERETTGIWVWDQLFYLPTTDGEEVAVLLMDTQGTFDSLSTVRDNATIFGLSTLLSSFEIYNLFKQLQEDDLQHLELFTEYGRLALSGEQSADTESKPFQALMFLVRDWGFLKDHPLGKRPEYLEKFLQTQEEQHDDLKKVRNHVIECFDELSCFLLPHPGLEVVEDPDFDGRLSVVRGSFKEQLDSLVNSVFSPEHLTVKKINGKAQTCEDLIEYFKQYMKIYQSDELPEPQTALRATAIANHIRVKDQAVEKYDSEMEAACGESYLAPEKFEVAHEEAQRLALILFSTTKKLGSDEVTKEYLDILKAQIAKQHKHYESLNDSRYSLAMLQTPLTLLLVFIIAHAVSHAWTDNLLSFIGLSFLLTPLDLCYVLVIVLIGVYILAVLKGKENPALAQVRGMVDEYTPLVYDKAIAPGLAKANETIPWGSISQVLANAAASQATKKKKE